MKLLKGVIAMVAVTIISNGAFAAEKSIVIYFSHTGPSAPSGTATLLRLSPNYQFCLRSLLAVTNFRHPRLSWLDGRCVQGPGTYSPRHG